MKKTYINPTTTYTDIAGTKNDNMISNQLNTPFLTMADELIINDENILFYQNINNEQIDLSTELLSGNSIYNTLLDKINNHTLLLNNQSNYYKDNETKWVLNINTSVLLRNYLFAKIKSDRVFEGLTNNLCVNTVDDFIFNMIDNNLIYKYNLSELNLYIEYVDLSTNNRLKYENKYDIKSNILTNMVKNKSIRYNDNDAIISFSQERKSNDFCFNYSFDIKYKKI